jgi:putative ABC transport system permease protein
MIARLKPGMTPADAAADADRMTKLVVQEQGPEFARADWSLWVKPANEMIVGDVRPALLMLLGAVGFVLLIACANLANLLLVRGTTRRREMAVRTALGAGRWRITREILAECLVLSVLGAAGGLGLAAAAVRSLVAWGPERLPRLSGITIDAHVLMFTGAVAVLTTLLFGLAPAVQAARGSLQGVIKAGGRGAAGGDGRRRARFGLVVSEIALSMILLAGAGLMIKSFRRLIAVDPGFRADNVLTMRTSLPAAKYTTPEAIADFYDRARIAIKAIPGVKVAGAGVVLPMEGGGWTQSFQIEGYQPPSGGASPWGDFRVVTPGYFEALGIVLRRGRGFEETDMASGRPVAVVDEVLAQQYWPGQDPIGKRVGFGGPDGVVWRDVVGVVAHILQNGPKDDRRTQLYVPLSQFPVATMGFAIRTTGSPAAQVSAVRKAIQSVDPIQPIFAAQPMVVLASEANAQPRFMAFLLGSFAVLAAVLAAVGIYGVMSYTVAQDTREIGIRLALGAREERVLGAVLRRGVGLAVGGVLVGMGGTLALGKLLASQLFEVSPADPIILVSVGTVLIGVALGASFFPARRAMAVDPIVALRNE